MIMKSVDFAGYDGSGMWTVCGVIADSFEQLADCIFPTSSLYVYWVLSVPKFTAILYCICLSIDLQYTSADAAQMFDKFWDTR